MEEIGLFPLGMVLLPTEQVPLHIFEERYKELIGECLEEEREFGLVFADDDGIRAVGTRAVVTEVLERFDDGRMNVVVEGRDRFRLLELTSGRVYQTGEVEPVADDPEPAEADDVERALEMFRRLVELTGSDVEEPDPAVPQLSFALAARFDFASPLKQELLQETSERVRMENLCRLLEAAADAVERQQEIAARAQTNGRVHPRGDSPPAGGEA
jgi:Lon protease-like protein